MKHNENEKYVKLGVTGAAVVMFGFACYWLTSSFPGLWSGLGVVLRILSPFIDGAVIAYLVTPVCKKLERLFRKWFKGKRDRLASALAILCSLLLAIMVVLALLLLVIPQLVKSVTGLVQVLPGQLEEAYEKLNAAIQEHPDLVPTWERISGEVNTFFNNWMNSDMPATVQNVLSGAVTQVASVVSVIMNLLLGLVVSIYLLARRRQLAAQAQLILKGLCKPSLADWIEREVRYADRMFNGFFMGKLLDAAIIGTICFIGCLVMQFESPVLIAVIIGVTNIIPFFGPLIGAVPCGLLLLLENPLHCLMFVIFIIVLQQLDGNVIGPRILGNTTGLSGLWVMFAIVLFGGLWGLSGMIVGVPLMAVLYDLMRQLVFFGLHRHRQEELIESYNDEFHK